MRAENYLSQLQNLLPLGIAWPRDPDAVLTRLLSAWAEEFARINDRAEQLFDEIDPRTTNELLSDWERVFGLPDPCAVALLDELDPAQRRAAVIAHMDDITGQSLADYERLIRAMGYEVKITAFDLHDVMMDVDYPITVPPWQYVWSVSAPAVTVNHLSTMDTVDDPLAWWGNVVLECVIRRLKQAHTTVIFTYQTE